MPQHQPDEHPIGNAPGKHFSTLVQFMWSLFVIGNLY